MTRGFWRLRCAVGCSRCGAADERSTWQDLETEREKFLLLAAAAPVLWLAYNAIVYRNPLEFANGPYSAKAIEQRKPGRISSRQSRLPTAFSYFLKSAEMNLAAEGLAKTLDPAGAGRSDRRPSPGSGREATLWPLLLLWVPLPFYALSVAYSGVPIFMPVWWPFSYYNVRYGLELLPAFAVFAALWRFTSPRS